MRDRSFVRSVRGERTRSIGGVARTVHTCLDQRSELERGRGWVYVACNPYEARVNDLLLLAAACLKQQLGLGKISTPGHFVELLTG